MSTPTQVTEAHRKLAADLCRHATGSNRALHHVPKFARLIADSEARAVAAAVTALTCTHHNDQQRAECPVCLVVALTAERDHWQKIAVSASQEREHNANVAQVMTAERDQLRAENERLKDGGVQRIKDTLATTLDARDAANARAERAEADKARLDWLEANPEAIAASSVHKSTFGRKVWWRGGEGDYDTARAAIDAGMREGAK